MSYEKVGEPLHLHAEDLWSKHGFRDGDILSTLDMYEDRQQEIERMLNGANEDDVLFEIVQRYLVPAIGRATGERPNIVRIGTHHNPVRHEDEGRREMPEAYREIVSAVTMEELANAAHAVKQRASAA